MIVETWEDVLDFVWWALTGREGRPRMRISLRPSRSAVAAVGWAWMSAVVLLGALVFTGDVNNPLPTWVFAVMAAIALLWAPTQYARFADSRRLRRLAAIALAIGAPVWFLPVPPDVGISGVHRFALWALIGIATGLAAPLLALPLRVLRSSAEDGARILHR
jgi:hypothetical protein